MKKTISVLLFILIETNTIALYSMDQSSSKPSINTSKIEYCSDAKPPLSPKKLEQKNEITPSETISAYDAGMSGYFLKHRKKITFKE